MLSVINPTVTPWNFLFAVQVFKVAISELVCADVAAELGVSDVLHLPPPFFESRSANVVDGAVERHGGREVMQRRLRQL